MTNKFRLNKKSNGLLIEVSEKSDSKEAAIDILSFVAGVKGIVVKEEDVKVSPIDDNTFLVVYNGDDFLLKKIK